MKKIQTVFWGSVALVSLAFNSQAAVTTYFNDYPAWATAYQSVGFQQVQLLQTNASNVSLATEVGSPPTRNRGLGTNTLTFEDSEVNLYCRGFIVKALQANSQFTFDDDEGSGNLPTFDNALSVGDLDNYENDDFEISFPAGEPPAYAISFVLRDSAADNAESLTVYGENNVVLATVPGSALVANQPGTIGLISDEPITRIVFNEGAGGDDIAIADFAFDNADGNDSDGDFLTDCEEVRLHGTDPRDQDSDDDSLMDFFEINNGTDPNDPDSDDDGANDGVEFLEETDPNDPDSDDDGANDGIEISLGTDPNDDDTDNDTLLDGNEITLGTDPLSADPDNDELTDPEELALGTEPNDADTDDDTLLDGTDPDPLTADPNIVVSGEAGMSVAHSTMQAFAAAQYYIAADATLFQFPGAPSGDTERAYLGEIRLYAPPNFAFQTPPFPSIGPTIPTGWLLADGSILNIVDYQELFAVIGTTFGGDGRFTFQLPDLRGRSPIGIGSVAGRPSVVMGQKQGGETNAFTEAELHGHTHDIPTGGTSGVTGSGVAHNVQQPTIGLNFIIAVQGNFTSPASGAEGITLGDIRIWTRNFPPDSQWVNCEGQLLNINNNASLFSLLGNQFGGDGASTFAVPDLRGRIPIDDGTTHGFAATPGETATVMTHSSLPNHTHEVTPGAPVSLIPTGDGQAFNNMQPSLALNYMINLDGVFLGLGISGSPSLGEISIKALPFVPRSFVATSGSTLQISGDSALFSLIGGYYGTNASSTFDMPDFRDRSVIGVGTGNGLTPRTLNDIGGANNFNLSLAEMAAHTHKLSGSQTDSDGDGAIDDVDAFVFFNGATTDTDGDGKPNEFLPTCDSACQTASGLEEDLDDDNDGIPDTEDPEPLIPAATNVQQVPFTPWSLVVLAIVVLISASWFRGAGARNG
ncbi:MAG: tail fiber protein [Pseudomonadota bacterium]